METQKEASQETIDKIKSLPRIPYETFKELIRTGEVIPSVKFKKPKTIFFDENTGMFVYMNPYHMELCKCGQFKTDEDGQ